MPRRLLRKVLVPVTPTFFFGNFLRFCIFDSLIFFYDILVHRFQCWRLRSPGYSLDDVPSTIYKIIWRHLQLFEN
ncbi:Uncharacterized protein APZ42_031426 [Daphnia magna]|uniref:Uncharacterized protein n=1 Tax=Daphnia magna TaxID=35525 RepID=A0A164MVM6_9CRUS|nr:Uncharacterized protein APZ42_031426 [Daphnia magna]